MCHVHVCFHHVVIEMVKVVHWVVPCTNVLNVCVKPLDCDAAC